MELQHFMGCDEDLLWWKHILFETVSWCSQGCFYICLMCQGVRAGVCRGSLWEKSQVLPFVGYSQSQLAPVDLLQGTAEPVSWSGGASMKKWLKKGRKQCAAFVRDRSDKCVRETTLQTPSQRTRKIRKCSRCWSRNSPAVHKEDCSDAGCSLIAWTVHTREGFLAGTGAQGEKPMQKKSVLKGLYLVEWTRAGAGKMSDSKGESD